MNAVTHSGFNLPPRISIDGNPSNLRGIPGFRFAFSGETRSERIAAKRSLAAKLRNFLGPWWKMQERRMATLRRGVRQAASFPFASSYVEQRFCRKLILQLQAVAIRN